MNKANYIVIILAVLLLIPTLSLNTWAYTYSSANYADEVTAHTLGTGDGHYIYQDPDEALGGEDGGYYQTGEGGTITLKFTDNYLTGDGTNNYDLAIMDLGAEDGIAVYTSTDNSTWLNLGFIFAYNGGANWYMFDIDAISGYSSTAQYQYVKIVDDNSINGWVTGADIDAVAAVNESGTPVPEPT